jgi:tetratricopeptide (TPR) repeat protein
MASLLLALQLFGLVTAAPPDPFTRGEELRTRGRLREALIAYQEATLAMADPAPAYRNAAMIELALGDRELAHIDYERYLNLRPHAEDAFQVRAVLAELDRVAARIPRSSCEAGNRLFDEGQLERAADAYRGCLGEHPQDATLWRRIGRSLMRVGDWPGALAAYRRYLELAPDASDALFVRAIVRGR